MLGHPRTKIVLLSAAIMLCVLARHCEAVVPDDWIKISFSVDNSSVPNFRDGYQRHRDGNTNSSGIERSIAFGYEAAKKQFPSMASLSIWGDYDWYHVCGAVLISPQYLLSAAHCFVDVSPPFVGLGGTELGDFDETFTISEVFIPSQYDNDEYRQGYDIAVVMIDGFSKMEPARLPTKPVALGTRLTAVGWGVTENSDYLPEDLLYTYLKAVDEKSCSLPNGKSYGLLCVEGEYSFNNFEADTCGGDSGGPSFIGDTNTVVGITSFGEAKRCGYKIVDSGLTSVYSFVDAISSISGIDQPEFYYPSTECVTYSYKQKKGYRLKGGRLIEKFNSGSLSNCKDACAATADCRALNYLKSKKRCYLYESDIVQVKKAKDSKYYYGQWTCNTNDSCKKYKYTSQKGFRLSGGTIIGGRYKSGSLKKCGEACAKSTECNSFNYLKNGKYCSMYKERPSDLKEVSDDGYYYGEITCT